MADEGDRFISLESLIAAERTVTVRPGRSRCTVSKPGATGTTERDATKLGEVCHSYADEVRRTLSAMLKSRASTLAQEDIEQMVHVKFLSALSRNHIRIDGNTAGYAKAMRGTLFAMPGARTRAKYWSRAFPTTRFFLKTWTWNWNS
jgi:hypothetical protein